MTRLTLPILLLFTIISFVVACRRSNISPGIPGFTGVLVESPGCSHYIVKLLGGPIPDSSMLAKTWTDTATHSTFTNVFTVGDWITFGQADLSVGDTFTFTLNGPDPNAGKVYYTCAIWPYATPPDTLRAENIQKIGYF